MTLSKNIKKYREANGFTQIELANKLNLSRNAISQYENGKREPGIETQLLLVDLFGISLDELNGRSSTIAHKDYITINVYGSIPAGIPIEAIEDISDTEDISFKEYDKNKTYLGLKVDGDSMYPKYLNGDTVIIEKTPDCESGTDAAVYVNGYEATLKTVIKNSDGTITLRPINPNYSPQTYGDGDDPVRILGVVKEIRRKI